MDAIWYSERRWHIVDCTFLMKAKKKNWKNYAFFIFHQENLPHMVTTCFTISFRLFCGFVEESKKRAKFTLRIERYHLLSYTNKSKIFLSLEFCSFCSRKPTQNTLSLSNIHLAKCPQYLTSISDSRIFMLKINTSTTTTNDNCELNWFQLLLPLRPTICHLFGFLMKWKKMIWFHKWK